MLNLKGLKKARALYEERRAAKPITDAQQLVAMEGAGVWAAKKTETDAELYIYEQIGEDFWTGAGVTGKSVAEALGKVKGAKTLSVYINSPGGDAFEGLAIYELIKRCDASEKTCFVDGIAASAASVIAMAGDKIVMGTGSNLMVHRSWSIALGNAGDMRSMADVLDTLDTSIANVYAAKTGKSPTECLAVMEGKEKSDDGTWMTAEEAVAAGFADEVARAEDPEDDADPDAKASAVLRIAASTQKRIADAKNVVARLTEKLKTSPGQPGSTRSGQPARK